MVQIKDKCKLTAEEIKIALSNEAEKCRADAKSLIEDRSFCEERYFLRALDFTTTTAETIENFLLRTDPELDAEEIKRELMYLIDELHAEGHLAMKNESLSDEERLPIIRRTADASAAICTFLSRIGVEIRAASGSMLWDSLGFFHWEQTLKINLMRKERAEEVKR